MPHQKRLVFVSEKVELSEQIEIVTRVFTVSNKKQADLAALVNLLFSS